MNITPRTRKLAAALAAMVAAGLGLGACYADDTHGGKAPAPVEQEHPKEAVERQADKLDTVVSDVKIKKVWVGDPYGLGESMPVVDVEVFNHGSKTADIDYTIDLLDGDGNRVEILYGYAEHVSPGQTVDSPDPGIGDEDPLVTVERDVKGPLKAVLTDVTRS